eukprot:2465321-Pleurochrysis_carterae.AAC.1
MHQSKHQLATHRVPVDISRRQRRRRHFTLAEIGPTISSIGRSSSARGSAIRSRGGSSSSGASSS